ncbi:hypothetical protein [Chryseobacterium sp. FH2]|uniref:hypothetical protein n=1 Tax=Chryseobacterium sp. FH2 TaxID=1674291 RepID=UPI00065A9171|nr:hypothetical protein [Chryseobacterium sp. FH2]
MKNILVIILFICACPLACKKSPEKTSSANATSDTIFLREKEILFISPSDKNIENLKKKCGDDFYTIADDANNYFSQASTYLDSLKISYKNYNNDKIIGFKQNNKFIEIQKYKNPWYSIFYQNGKYKVLDLIDFREEYSKFFNNKNNTNSNLNSKKIIDSIAGNKYFIVKEQNCDLNQDTLIDKIVVLGNNNDIDPQNPETRIAPILILLNKQNKKYKILTNEDIYPNDFGDAFRRLVIKSPFFTIELSNEVPDKYTSDKYITFKFNEEAKEIFLYKYGENIDWNDGKKTNILCSEKNFGKILFQQFNSNEIQNKCSH